jgi:sulfhydrogenase subunit beta (sulfur reductase)
MIKIFNKNGWIDTLKAMRTSHRVFVPVREGDFHTFRVLTGDTKPNFDFYNTRLSPKAIVYPQSERMFECRIDREAGDSGILKEAPKDYSPRAVVGVRPCDAQAFQIVKRNFDNPECRDPWWVRGFESTILVGLGCSEPCPTCFCTSVGGGPFNEEFLDVILTDLGDTILAKGITDKGKDLVLRLTGGADADEKTVKEACALATAAGEKVRARLEADRIGEKSVTALFNAPFWEDVAFSCINCGTCTFLCPTCWCFDIQDEVCGSNVDRIRNWDTCMSPLFTLEGSGHNPRDKKVQRVRQRFMHKLKYYPDRFKKGVQCSGCGRCVRYCPVNIDIRRVAGLMNEI